MRSPFDDPILYDWEYRRRRDDVRFYRTLADERGGPILDLGCGTGRLLAPLVRDGHQVVGLDRSRPMLERAAARVARLGAAGRARSLLVRGDLRALGFARRFAFALAAFHTIQHCESDADLRRFLAGVAGVLVPGGWLAFDVFAPTQRFVERRGFSGATRFRDPRTGRATIYRERHSVEPAPESPGGRILAMTFRYEPANPRGAGGRARVRNVSLRHRLFQPRDIAPALVESGFKLIASWGGFDGRPLDVTDENGEQHVYLARLGIPRA
ncbi:MAG TPA: class I SAM-dependent methyltransferase [Polyangia bacterium]|nr:class I SAM-dependent methyltransferase [Polyangia bacterium]